MYRDHTKVIRIGDRVIGGGNPILIQSMTNTKTEDVEATVAQILRLEEAGCEIIRCTVPTMEAALALKEIKKQIHIPLVADIHFDYKLALKVIDEGIDKIRLNPGNITDQSKVKLICDKCKEKQEIHEKFPDFNVRNYGYSQLSKFIENMNDIVIESKKNAKIAKYKTKSTGRKKTNV